MLVAVSQAVSFAEAAEWAAGEAEEGNVILTLGAGSVAQVASLVLDALGLGLLARLRLGDGAWGVTVVEFDSCSRFYLAKQLFAKFIKE